MEDGEHKEQNKDIQVAETAWQRHTDSPVTDRSCSWGF